MFPYYGGKGRIAHLYPAPRYPLVIEPFAGAAWYSIHHQSKRTYLSDVSPYIFETWKWLIHSATPEDFRSFPPYKVGEDMEIHQPAGKDYFYRYYGAQPASARPYVKAGKWNTFPVEQSIDRLERVKGWEIIHGGFECWGDIEATWFIDPPYRGFHGKRYYRFWKTVNYDRLRDFCLSRRGQVIVCERDGADWLPFQPLRVGRTGVNHLELKEAIYLQ